MTATRTMRVLAAVTLAAALLTAALAATAEARTTTSLYHPTPGARTFAVSSAGWTGSKASGGPCSVALLCPPVTNSYQASGGSPGGYLRSQFGPPLGVGGERSAIWKSPSFVYRGAGGQFPDEVSFDLDHRADVNALLSVTGDEADFTVRMVDKRTGTGVNLTGPTTLGNAADWTSIQTESINPSKLVIGDRYYIEITSRIKFGVDAVPSSTADYDNVVVTATQKLDRTPCVRVIEGTAKADKLRGTFGGDLIKGYGGADTIQALKGDDCLVGGAGADRLSGSGGDDELHGNQAADTLRGGGGADVITGGAGDDVIRGVRGGDTMKGSAGSDDIAGGKGQDVAHGAGGNDTIRGGVDPDKLYGGSGRDTLLGLAGDDKLVGGGGKDTLRGGSGRDRIAAGAGADFVSGGAGRDTIRVRGNGRDKVKCGGGKDTVFADRHDRVGPTCEHVVIGH